MTSASVIQKTLVNSLGNVPRVGVVPRFSDLEVIALSLTVEALVIYIGRAPSYGYCVSQGKYYYGYKFHGLTGMRGPRKMRKRIETNFSQLCDQFLLIHNYAKNIDGFFTRNIGKISAFTVLQYINKTNNKPIGQIKYALV